MPYPNDAIGLSAGIGVQSPNSTYPSHYDELGAGGYRAVEKKSDLDAIPAKRRRKGMLVRVLETTDSDNLAGKILYYNSGDNTAFNDVKLVGQNGYPASSGWNELQVGGDALPSQTDNGGKFLTTNGSSASWDDIPSGGTVTEVNVDLPTTVFTNPSTGITTNGTLEVTFKNQSANTIFAGPASDGDATPTFRELVSADIPTLNQNTSGTAAGLSAILNTDKGGTGLDLKTISTNKGLLYSDTSGNVLKLFKSSDSGTVKAIPTVDKDGLVTQILESTIQKVISTTEGVTIDNTTPNSPSFKLGSDGIDTSSSNPNRIKGTRTFNIRTATDSGKVQFVSDDASSVVEYFVLGSGSTSITNRFLSLFTDGTSPNFFSTKTFDLASTTTFTLKNTNSPYSISGSGARTINAGYTKYNLSGAPAGSFTGTQGTNGAVTASTITLNTVYHNRADFIYKEGTSSDTTVGPALVFNPLQYQTSTFASTAYSSSGAPAITTSVRSTNIVFDVASRITPNISQSTNGLVNSGAASLNTALFMQSPVNGVSGITGRLYLSAGGTDTTLLGSDSSALAEDGSILASTTNLGNFVIGATSSAGNSTGGLIFSLFDSLTANSALYSGALTNNPRTYFSINGRNGINVDAILSAAQSSISVTYPNGAETYPTTPGTFNVGAVSRSFCLSNNHSDFGTSISVPSGTNNTTRTYGRSLFGGTYFKSISHKLKTEPDPNTGTSGTYEKYVSYPGLVTTTTGSATVTGIDTKFLAYFKGSITSSGTISGTAGTSTITGSGTTFTDFKKGEFITVGSNKYTIKSVASTTSLTIYGKIRVDFSSSTYIFSSSIRSNWIRIGSTNYSISSITNNTSMTLSTTVASGTTLSSYTIPPSSNTRTRSLIYSAFRNASGASPATLRLAGPIYDQKLVDYAVNTYYEVGETIRVTSNNRLFLVTTAGIIGSSAPSNTTGAIFTSGSAQIKYIGTSTSNLENADYTFDKPRLFDGLSGRMGLFEASQPINNIEDYNLVGLSMGAYETPTANVTIGKSSVYRASMRIIPSTELPICRYTDAKNIETSINIGDIVLLGTNQLYLCTNVDTSSDTPVATWTPISVTGSTVTS